MLSSKTMFDVKVLNELIKKMNLKQVGPMGGMMGQKIAQIIKEKKWNERMSASEII